MKKILVIAGEASGDRLAAHALRKAQELAHERDESLELYGIGGDECKKIGLKLLHTSDEMSVVGFAEVAKRYFFFRNVFNEIIALLDNEATRPDTLFLVDYPGFNLRVAKEAHKRGIRVVFYVSPQVWAWKAGRIKQIVLDVDELLVIFPFEEKIYKDTGMKAVHFVGHPLTELVEEEEKSFVSREEFAKQHHFDPQKKWLAIFPGSRQEEVARHAHTMYEAAIEFDIKNEYEKIVIRSSEIGDIAYPISSEIKAFRGSSAEIHQLMHHSSLGILKSGTTTLEAGLMQLPGVICYKTSFATYQIAKRFVTLANIGLVNIVLGKTLYPEFIQNDFTPTNIVNGLKDVASRKKEFTSSLSTLRQMLHSDGDRTPSERVASYLFQT